MAKAVEWAGGFAFNTDPLDNSPRILVTSRVARLVHGLAMVAQDILGGHVAVGFSTDADIAKCVGVWCGLRCMAGVLVSRSTSHLRCCCGAPRLGVAVCRRLCMAVCCGAVPLSCVFFFWQGRAPGVCAYLRWCRGSTPITSLDRRPGIVRRHWSRRVQPRHCVSARRRPPSAGLHGQRAEPPPCERRHGDPPGRVATK